MFWTAEGMPPWLGNRPKRASSAHATVILVDRPAII
jgi:hypothetical protein